MKVFTVDLYNEFHLSRPENGRGYLTCYVREPANGISRRPAMLVLPGGGYSSCSDREGEPIATKFVGEGYQAFVLDYSVSPVKFPVSFLEASLSMAYIRGHAKELYLTGMVGGIGFSAGAHLLGLLSACYEDSPAELPVKKEVFRPDASVFSYPVVTGNPAYYHGDSVTALMGENAELRAYFSIEDHVTANSSPAYIWTTATDAGVPAQNSLLLAQAYAQNKAPYELHVFAEGPHGLSLCTEETRSGVPEYVNERAAAWLSMAISWLKLRGFSLEE